jgi:hypothetical protein
MSNILTSAELLQLESEKKEIIIEIKELKEKLIKLEK